MLLRRHAAGGALGQRLVLEIGDGACDPEQAVAVANQLVDKGVVFVAGHFCSGSSIPASEVYDEEGVVPISPASANPLLTERGLDDVFRTCGRDDQQGVVAGNFIAEETKKRLNKRGIQEVLYGTVTAGAKDYSALVAKLKANNIELLYYGGYHPEGGLIVRRMREQGLGARLVSGDKLITREYWAITGDAGEGTLVTSTPDPRDNPAAAGIVDKFRAAGYEPEGYTLYSYAAIQAWAQAAEKAGTIALDAIIKVLKSDTFDTVLGNIGFDQKGDPTGETYVMYEWTTGELKYFEAI
ncbi:MAG: branched-chain amino acid ABC transporter substrate-binding protein [Alphaproteobacteria bacterium]